MRLPARAELWTFGHPASVCLLLDRVFFQSLCIRALGRDRAASDRRVAAGQRALPADARRWKRRRGQTRRWIGQGGRNLLRLAPPGPQRLRLSWTAADVFAF